MRSWLKVAVLATVLAVVGGFGGAWASAGSAPGGPNGASGPVAVRAAGAGRDLGAGTTETKYVPIAPCRLADTRHGGTPIAAGATRSFAVRGTGVVFANQGGTAGGCGIPSAAGSIEATITAVGAAGTGFLRAFPGGGVAPSATFLNYIATFNPTNTGSIALSGCFISCVVSTDLSVKVFGSATHVVIDVQGYSIKAMDAVVNANGTLARSSRVVSAPTVSGNGYRVVFDRNLSSCSWLAVVGEQNTGSTPGFATTALDISNNDGIFVETFDGVGTATQEPFHLLVTC